MAANEIGEFVKYRLHDTIQLNYVMNKLSKLLRSNSWETREATGIAIRGICEMLPQYVPKKRKGTIPPLFLQKQKNFKPLSTFNIQEVCKLPLLLKSVDISKKKKREGDNIVKKKRKIGVGGEAVKVEFRVKETISEEIYRDDEWTLQYFVDSLIKDLRNPRWWVRHGVALGLSETLQRHFPAVGKHVYFSEETFLENLNFRFLEDLCVEILTVLTLDRFIDFMGEVSHAPVRESCAQILSALVQGMHENSVLKLVQCLHSMSVHSEWQVRHSSMFGLKAIIQHRRSCLSKEVLNGMVIPILSNNMADVSEDVKTQALEALIPLVEYFVVNFNEEILKKMVGQLWFYLSNEKDDLAGYVASTMNLMSELYDMCGKHGKSMLGFPVEACIGTLFRFLRNTLQSVRVSCLNIFQRIIKSSTKKIDDVGLINRSLRYLFQNFLLENDETCLQHTLETWKSFLRVVDRNVLSKVIGEGKLFQNWVYSIQLSQGAFPKNVDKNQLIIIQELGEEEISNYNLRLSFFDESEEFTMWMRCAEAFGYAYLFISSQLRNLLTTLIDQLINKSKWATHVKIGLLFVEAVIKWQVKLKSPWIDVHYVSWINSFIDGSKVVRNFLETNANHTVFIGCAQKLMVFYSKVGVNFQQFLDDNSGINTSNFSQLTEGKYYNECLNRVRQNQQKIQQLQSNISNLRSSAMILDRSVNKHMHVIKTICLGVKFSLKENQILAQKDVKSSLMSLFYCMKDLFVEIQEKSSKCIATFVRFHPKFGGGIVKNLCSLLWKCKPSTLSVEDIVEEGKEKELKRKIKAPRDVRSMKEMMKGGEVDTRQLTPNEITFRGAEILLKNLIVLFLPSVRNGWTQLLGKLPEFYSQTIQVLKSATSINQGNCEGINRSLFILAELMKCSSQVGKKDILRGNEKDSAFQMELVSQNIKFAFSPLTCDLACESVAGIIFNQSSYCSNFEISTMSVITEKVVPLIKTSTDDLIKRSAIFLIHHLIEKLQIKILPYVVYFVIPMLKRISDHDEITRRLSSKCFAFIMKIIHLDNVHENLPQSGEKAQERKFLEQLLDSKKIDPIAIDPSVIVNVKLRRYQLDGVSWLNFLRKFNLHGILCDDMGLGKTLQTICIIAHDINEKRLKLFDNMDQIEENSINPSMVICPVTLIDHWVEEFGKFCPSLKVLKYVGAPGYRRQLCESIRDYDVVVLSYSVAKNDIDYILRSSIMLNYLALDEGHMIRNYKTKTSQAIFRFRSEHRLILSGTPIQNSVEDVWSLFNFLMPGYLGGKREFDRVYTKPIHKSRNSRAKSKDKGVGIKALQELHQKVLRLILRRMKEEVLDDLPPKIIQDYFCVLNDVQKAILLHYEQKLKGDKGSSFEQMEFLRKLVNHPRLILNHLDQNNRLFNVVKGLQINDYRQSPKLCSLYQLFLDCGMSQTGDSKNSTHRYLIFSEYKDTLDLIQNSLFRPVLKELRFLRLDADVEQDKRYSVATKFNSDPSYDVLLLTKKIGGIGLNLTGADIVIFVEHDWNPAIDVQAMDRAHRIGQKKTVCVYRLITKDSIEEKIMGLQKFKQNISNSIINEDNKNIDGSTNILLNQFDPNQQEDEGDIELDIDLMLCHEWITKKNSMINE